ncbi:PREDICTED: caspase recruitment domain-containing protein 8-like [Charadrius vociferus]|uniref:caspase recruitment domain-containing protein 8-like n=1 Tax=Charadrius vociferus TaxID=50402 RepID=UPI000521CA78|nr:PREDICTED: caspase recruitment domain-containing protein 8-like [Charadrius vociferus]
MAKRVPVEQQESATDSPDEFPVLIKTGEGKAFSMLVSLDDTVRDLKAKLSVQDSSVSPEERRLIYCGRQMEDEQTLQHYKITPYSTLHQCEVVVVTSLNTKAEELPVNDFSGRFADESGAFLGAKQELLIPCCCLRGSKLPRHAASRFPVNASTTPARAHLPEAGTFQCSITGLSFKVKSAVIITYKYSSWTKYLSKGHQEMWVPAGPLFHIQVQPGVVEAVHLPHFVCLAEGVDSSLCSIAHFTSGKMTLERPTRLMAFSAVLENPSFSLLGVLWRKIRSALNSLPVHSVVLIFQQLNAANTTLHLYLIPDDNSVKQEQLPFCYKSPKEQQLFFEIYIRNMAEEIGLRMTDTRNDTEVWRASLRSGDINIPARASKTSSGAAFMKKHRTKLCLRMGQLSTILLHLRDANVISSNEEEEVRGQGTSERKNQFLLDLVERKGQEAQEQLYRILEKYNPYLITDLEKSN